MTEWGSTVVADPEARLSGAVKAAIDKEFRWAAEKRTGFPLFARVLRSRAYKDPGYGGENGMRWWRSIYVACPLCGETHQHGAGWGERGLIGDRAAHCIRGDVKAPGYLLLDATPLHVEEGEVLGDSSGGLEPPAPWVNRAYTGLFEIHMMGGDGYDLRTMTTTTGGSTVELAFSADGVWVASTSVSTVAWLLEELDLPVVSWPSTSPLAYDQVPPAPDYAWFVATADRGSATRAAEGLVGLLDSHGWVPVAPTPARIE